MADNSIGQEQVFRTSYVIEFFCMLLWSVVTVGGYWLWVDGYDGRQSVPLLVLIGLFTCLFVHFWLRKVILEGNILHYRKYGGLYRRQVDLDALVEGKKNSVWSGRGGWRIIYTLKDQYGSRVVFWAGITPDGFIGPGSFHHQNELQERLDATPVKATGAVNNQPAGTSHD